LLAKTQHEADLQAKTAKRVSSGPASPGGVRNLRPGEASTAE